MTDDIYAWSGSFNDLAKGEQIAVAELIVSGRAVRGTIDDLIARLKRTLYVALLFERGTDRIVAAAALKQPGAAYRRSSFAKADASISDFEAAPELGYVVIASDMRGRRLSGDLVSAITKRIREPAFATTDSNTIRNNLERSGFKRAGVEWQGRKGMLSLWTFRP
jgi:predicted GNAT family N-acyltransferase